MDEYSRDAETVNQALRRDLSSLRANLDSSQAVWEDRLNTKKQEYEELQEKYIKARSNETRALAIALPTVATPDSSIPLVNTETTPVPRDPASPPVTISTTSKSRISEKVPDPDKFKGERSDLRRFS